MKIISTRELADFCAEHPRSAGPLHAWRRIIEINYFAHWADLKETFNSVNKVGPLTVFNIGGNKYRLVAYIRFDTQTLYIRSILTHRDYDKGRWKL